MTNKRVTTQYADYTARADVQRASLVAGLLQESWIQWREANDQDRESLLLPTEEKRPRMGLMLNRYVESEHGRPREELVHITVVNSQGVTIYSTITPTEREPIKDFKQGEPIVVQDETVGYVLAGSMINQKMNAVDTRMLATINRTLTLSALVATLLILIIGVLLLGKLLSPLTHITSAAKKLASGDYKARTGVDSSDEIGNLALQFDEMAHSIEGAEEWKRRIIADTAHELRTPAALLLGRLEMMKDGIYPTDEDQLHSLYLVAQNFSHLISDMQKLASMEGGAVSLEKEGGDLIAFSQNQINLFLPEAHKKSITLDLKVIKAKGNKINIELDWNKLDQVLKNLISNGIRHTPEGGSLVLSLSENEKWVKLCVSDSGPGIPKDERIQIFDRFYRLDSSRNRDKGGYGLGLAISRAITEAHGGRIYVDSSDLGGAAFCVELPM